MNGNRQILYYLTFACEAFDKVPHHHSKLKLECYEVRNQLNSEVDIFLEEHMLPVYSMHVVVIHQTMQMFSGTLTH